MARYTIIKHLALYFATCSGNSSFPAQTWLRILHASGTQPGGGSLKHTVTVNGACRSFLWLFRVTSNSNGWQSLAKELYTKMLRSL